jgi:4-amino-4-deoxy-L-arabinose transferase-like glycosyltransferase
MNKKILYLVIVLAGILVGPKTLMNGMFMDGQQYACVAQNMAEGKGSFWHPYLSETWQKAGSNAFMEHPPLGFFLESIAFRILGESLYTERIFSLFLFAFSVVFLLLLIREWPLAQNQKTTLYWLVLLFWMSVPLASWSVQNNMWENFLVFFGLFSLWLQSRAYNKNRMWLFAIAGLLVSAGFFCKGVPALYPLAGPLILGFIGFRVNIRKIAIGYGLLIIGLLLPFLFIMQQAEAIDALKFYLNERLLFRVQNEPTGNSRWSTLSALFNELLPLLILGLLVYFIYRKKVNFSANSFFTAAIFLGLCASLPLMVTSVQRGFYLVPAFPWFALAGAIWFLPFAEQYLPKSHPKWENRIKWTSLFLSVALILAIVFTAGKPSRDAKILADVDSIATITGNNIILGTPDALLDHWNTQFYFIRFHHISFHCGSTDHSWYLGRKGEAAPQGFQLHSAFNEYDLFQSTKTLVDDAFN